MVDNDVVMLQVNQQRLQSRTKPRGQDEKRAVAGPLISHQRQNMARSLWLGSAHHPDDSLGALRQAARSLTLTLASYLSEFVAETLRASRTSQGAPLTGKENMHLLGANYWVQPIYQELLHATSGHNASVEGERKRPCSGLVKIIAKQRRAKTRAPAVDTACVTDWIGGFCPPTL